MAKKQEGPGRPPRVGAKAQGERFGLKLTKEEKVRWEAIAERQGISLAELVRESVETAIARGSSR